MIEAVEVFASLLERENLAARKADVDTLALLQDEKRSALAALSASVVPDDVLDALRARANENVLLIRHLTTCLQGMVSNGDTTYNAGGARPMGRLSRSWGHL